MTTITSLDLIWTEGIYIIFWNKDKKHDEIIYVTEWILQKTINEGCIVKEILDKKLTLD